MYRKPNSYVQTFFLMAVSAMPMLYSAAVVGGWVARMMKKVSGTGRVEHGRPLPIVRQVAHQAGVEGDDTISALTTRRWLAEPLGWQVVSVRVWPGV